MQFSESWLRSLVNPSLSSADLCHSLTMAGLEVEEVIPAAPAFSQVVVARVLACEKHPDADRLNLCRVDAGSHGELQIVCGAPNVAAGLVVPCALVGAKLPGVEIKQAKVRGIESFGMLCSARELGIAEDASGLLILPPDAPLGTDLRAYLDLDDQLITIKLTPNRADCLSLTGVAREVAAITGAPLTPVATPAVAPGHSRERGVRLAAPEGCPRYLGRIIQGVDAAAPTPDWMKRRLERSGLRSISAAVDVTNYVMLELGQPLHAFDNDQLSGDICVRHPYAGEQLELLNGQIIEPVADAVLIADETRALALGGIMGGRATGVTTTTRDIFLESAFFTPDAIVGKARALGFSSDASYRFERGVDFTLQAAALERATALIVEICGGSAGAVTEAVSPDQLPVRRPVCLRPARARQVLGLDISDDAMVGLLRGLGLVVEVAGQGLLVTPPASRYDIEIEEDLIEEVGRLFGYDNIPVRPPLGPLVMRPQPEGRRHAMALRRRVAALGYQETVNFSFVETAWEADFAGNTSPIVLANPIASQLAVMRSSLIGGLVNVLNANRKRQLDRVRVFEVGRCFLRQEDGQPVAGFAQPLRLAGLASAGSQPEQWGATNRAVDFFDVKGDVEALFQGAPLSFVATAHPALHPGRAAEVRLNGRGVGIIGELHPKWVQKYDLGTAPVVFELEMSALQEAAFPVYRELSRFPAVTRDLALIVPQSVSWDQLRQVLAGAASGIVQGLELFDLYHGKGIAEGRKSLAFRVLMQDTQRTLEEPEVEAAMAALVAAATQELGAELRQ